jgi:hypothetical protein
MKLVFTDGAERGINLDELKKELRRRRGVSLPHRNQTEPRSWSIFVDETADVRPVWDLIEMCHGKVIDQQP